MWQCHRGGQLSARGGDCGEVERRAAAEHTALPNRWALGQPARATRGRERLRTALRYGLQGARERHGERVNRPERLCENIRIPRPRSSCVHRIASRAWRPVPRGLAPHGPAARSSSRAFFYVQFMYAYLVWSIVWAAHICTLLSFVQTRHRRGQETRLETRRRLGS